MEQKKNTTRPSAKVRLADILLRTALVLLCLVMLSFHMMGSLFARYSTNADGTDGARVAKFDVDVTGALDQTKITCTALALDNGVYTVTVENNSEVAVRYVLSVELTPENGVTCAFDRESGDLAPGQTGESTLTFTVDWAAFTDGTTGQSKSADLDYTITVRVEQAD